MLAAPAITLLLHPCSTPAFSRGRQTERQTDSLLRSACHSSCSTPAYLARMDSADSSATFWLPT